LVFDAGFSNNSPIGVHDAVVVQSGAAIDITVLDNDRDLDGDALSIPNQLVLAPSHGIAVVQHTADGADYIRYTSTPGYVGEDSFTYTLEDGRGGTGSATVFVSVEALAAPQVESIVINDGSAQRSKVNSITVTFDSLVTVDPGAFELRRQGTSAPVGLIVALSEQNDRTVAVLTFSGAGIIGGSLFDGRYTLTMRGDKIRDEAGQFLDGDGDGVAGGDHHEAFFRRFGDSDGDDDVDRFDRQEFLSSLFRSANHPDYLWYFDWNNDGRVALIDLLAFTVASLVSQR
jgi:hypothetical protein